jgi:hypothetical protein
MARSKGESGGVADKRFTRARPPLIDIDDLEQKARLLKMRVFARTRSKFDYEVVLRVPDDIKIEGYNARRYTFPIIDGSKPKPDSAMDFAFEVIGSTTKLLDDVVSESIAPLAEISAVGDRIDRLNHENAEGLKSLLSMAAA